MARQKTNYYRLTLIDKKLRDLIDSVSTEEGVSLREASQKIAILATKAKKKGLLIEI